MTINVYDPVLGDNVPVKSIEVEDEQVPVHTLHSLPGTVETDIAAIKGHVDGVETALSTLIGHVDGLEALGTSLNGFVDGLEALQTTLATYVDGLEASLGAGVAQDRTTAASPSATRLSNGTAFYDAAKTGQLPTALGQTTMAGSVSVAHASDDPLIADILGSSTALGALNASCSASQLKGKRSVGFVLVGGGTLVGTLTAECFTAYTYEPTYFFDPLTGVLASSIAVNSAASNIVRGILMLPGGTNVRVKVTAYTSGTSQGLVAYSNVDPTLGLLLSLQTLLAPATPYIEQITAIPAVGGTASLFSSQTLVKGMVIRNCSTGGQLLYVTKAATTPTATNSYVLAPGESTMLLECTNMNAFKILASLSGGAACATGS